MLICIHVYLSVHELFWNFDLCKRWDILYYVLASNFYNDSNNNINNNEI